MPKHIPAEWIDTYTDEQGEKRYKLSHIACCGQAETKDRAKAIIEEGSESSNDENNNSN